MQKYICTNCKYIYNPYLGDPEQDIDTGTDFEDVDEFWKCPNCGENKDYFHEITPVLQEIYNMENITPEEERHVPFYNITNDMVYITMGAEDNPYVNDDEHFIEYIGIFDESGDEIEIIDFPNLKDEIVFDATNLDYFEVRASCSQHGVWKGIEEN